MWKKIVIIGGLAVAALGAGGAAWANAGSAVSATPVGVTAFAATRPAITSGATATAHTKGQDGKKHRAADALGHALHGTWVSKDKDGKFVTHQAVRGTVSSVSAASITVKADDGVSMSFAVTSTTKVRVLGAAKGTTSTISAVKVGDRAGVVGTGATHPTATHVVTGTGPRKAHGAGQPSAQPGATSAPTTTG